MLWAGVWCVGADSRTMHLYGEASDPFAPVV